MNVLVHRPGTVTQPDPLNMVKSLPRNLSARSRESRPSHSLARVLPLCLIGVAALLASACGSSNTTTTTAAILDTTPVAQAIERSIVKEHGVQTVVHCPSNVPKKAAYRFTCVAALDAGSYPVNVLELNARGGVSYSNSAPLRTFDTRGTEIAIKTAIRRQRHLSSTITCPKTVLEQTGQTFTCTAKTTKGITPFDVTEINDRGGVRFVGR